MKWAAAERQKLVDTLRVADPYGETLCVGWDVRRLLAHLVMREQEPVSMVRDGLARPAAGAEPQLSRLLETTVTPAGYQALVDRFDAGPPAWSPMSWASEKINLLEYVIHHEDIRRAGAEPAEARILPTVEQQAVWEQFGWFARVACRPAPVGVALATPDGAVLVAKKALTGVTLTGDPVELAMAVAGRREVAHIELTGPAEAVAQFSDWATGT